MCTVESKTTIRFMAHSNSPFLISSQSMVLQHNPVSLPQNLSSCFCPRSFCFHCSMGWWLFIVLKTSWTTWHCLRDSQTRIKWRLIENNLKNGVVIIFYNRNTAFLKTMLLFLFHKAHTNKSLFLLTLWHATESCLCDK